MRTILYRKYAYSGDASAFRVKGNLSCGTKCQSPAQGPEIYLVWRGANNRSRAMRVKGDQGRKGGVQKSKPECKRADEEGVDVARAHRKGGKEKASLSKNYHGLPEQRPFISKVGHPAGERK